MTQATLFTAPTTPLPGARQGNASVVLIVPHEEGERMASAMETWFQACSTEQPFALELVGTKSEQGFVLRASSEEQLELLCKQFAAQYPQAEIQRIAPSADPLLLRPGEHAVLGEFALSAPPFLPLKTFSGKALAEPGTDPLAGILAAMEAVLSGERVICQLALVHAPESWIARDIRKAVEHPLQEERDKAVAQLRGLPANANAGGFLRLLVGLITLLAVRYGYHWYEQHAWLALGLFVATGTCASIGMGLWLLRPTHHIYDMKLVAEKLMRAAFYTQLRVIVIGRQTTSAESHLRTLLSHLEVTYHQFTLASANGLFLKRVRHLDATSRSAGELVNAAFAFPYHHPLLRLLHAGAPCRDVWNGLELSGAFHLPQETADLPLVRRLSVKRLLFSPEVSHGIATTQATLPPTLIGHSQHRSHMVQVLLPFTTLFSHTFLIGRSRSGKSVLMQLMIRGAIQRVTDGSPQPGLFVIDPHHDLIEDLLGIIPPERLADVLLLDFTDTDFPVGLNPLDATMGFTRDQAVSNIMSCFEGVWKEFWGPRMSYFLKSVCLLLSTLNADLAKAGQADKQYTILDINPLLQYQDYAIQVLRRLDMSETWHQELLAWWQNVYFAMPKQSSFRQEVIMPILTKIGTFNDHQVLRRIVGQPRTTAPIHESITKGKLVFCALSSRDLDDASVNILGSTLMNLLHRAFATQQHVPLTRRRKVFVAVDELQNFSGSMFDKLLSEDTKFGCAMLLSTQNLKRLNQIKEGLLEIVLSNCENLCAFNVSAADAKILEAELQEKVSQKHIISQPRLHCYVRLAIAGQPLQFASVHVAQPASWKKGAAQQACIDQVRKLHRAKLLSVTTVDALHVDHLKQFLDVRHFAEKIDREVRAMQEKQQQREDTVQRAAQIRDHYMALTPMKAEPSSGPKNMPALPVQKQASIPGKAPQTHTKPSESAVTAERPARSETTVTPDNANGTEPASASSKRGSEEQATEQGRRKNHHRSSRRVNKLRTATKSPVGTPPPRLTQERVAPSEDADDDGHPRPFRSLSRRFSSDSEARERERRERG